MVCFSVAAQERYKVLGRNHARMARAGPLHRQAKKRYEDPKILYRKFRLNRHRIEIGDRKATEGYEDGIRRCFLAISWHSGLREPGSYYTSNTPTYHLSELRVRKVQYMI